MTRDKLGSDAGIAASTIAKLESGCINEPGFFTVWAICKVLRCDLDDLLGALQTNEREPEGGAATTDP